MVFFKRYLKKAGLRLGRNFIGLPTMGALTKSLYQSGCRVNTLVDVGVGQGTPGLYDAFRTAALVLVEPVREFEPFLKEITQKYGGTYHLTALGSQNGEQVMNVYPRHLRKSTLLARTNPQMAPNLAEQRAIPVTTLDLLSADQGFSPPFGLKIDTEGFEYQVVLGGAKFLQQTRFVIAEVSVARRFDGSYSFGAFNTLMEENGFVLNDIINIRKKSGGPVSYLDIVYLRNDH